MSNRQNLSKIKAIEQANKKRLLAVNPSEKPPIQRQFPQGTL